MKSVTLHLLTIAIVAASFLTVNTAAKADEYGITNGPEAAARLCTATERYKKQTALEHPSWGFGLYPQMQIALQLMMPQSAALAAASQR